MEIGNMRAPTLTLKHLEGIRNCRRVCLMFFTALAVLAVGCGEPNPSGRLPVSGTVTWNGEPLKTGKVLFLPDGKGRSASATVVDGEFELPAAKGVPIGMYKVRITCEEPTGKTFIDPELPDVPVEITKQILPTRYNSKTELTLTVDGPIEPLVYDLKAK